LIFLYFSLWFWFWSTISCFIDCICLYICHLH